MKTHSFTIERLGGIVLMVAAVIMLAGAAVANFTLIRSQTSFGGTPEQKLAAIAAHPSAWQLADVLIVIAIILTALGFVPITLGFGEAGRSWAWVGLLAFSISAVLGTIRRIVSIYLEPWVAVEGIDLNNITIEAFSKFGGGLGDWFTILAFTAVGLYGIALQRRPAFGSVGWIFIGGGAVGVLVHLVGAGIPAFIFFVTGALGVVFFMIDSLPDSGEA